jgi:antitoxin (DNA-binding transcriptional repressor) of toxin-antitoxin stability system
LLFVKEVGIRELKNHLSEYVRLVRAGEVVMVTDRGEVVAELRPPGLGGQVVDRYPGLEEMARRGQVRLGEPNRPGLYPRLPDVMPPGAAARLLDEERGDR